MARLALLLASSALSLSAPLMCSITADDDGGGGGGGGGGDATKSTMTKSEIDTLLEGNVARVSERLASLTPATRRKIHAAEETDKNRGGVLAAIDKLGDTPATTAEEPAEEPAEQKAPAAPPATPPATQDDRASEHQTPPTSTAEQADEGQIAALHARISEIEGVAAQATSRAAALEEELAPYRNGDALRDGDAGVIANLEQRLREASAVEPVEKVRGLILTAGEAYGIKAADGEGIGDLVERYIAAVEANRIELDGKLTSATEDLTATNQKLVNARKRNDPGALVKGRGTAKARKVGADFEALEGGEGDQSPLDKILSGDDGLELVFSNGTNELVEFAPYDVRGTSFDRHSGGYMLREAIVLKGSTDDTRVRGAALLRDGKQIAYAQFAEPVKVPRNQEVNFDRMIVFK